MLRRSFLQLGTAALAAPALCGRVTAADPGTSTPGTRFAVSYFDVPGVEGVYGLAAAQDGAIWLSGSRNGTLARFDPRSGETKPIALGEAAKPRRVLSGPDGAIWLTDPGRDALLRVEPADGKVETIALPDERKGADLDCAVFDGDGLLWFTGQAGIVGRLDPKTGKIEVRDAPKGRGAAGIAVSPSGELWFASVAGNYVARINRESFEIQPAGLPKEDQGPRDLSSDSKNRLWVAESQSGNVSCLEIASRSWKSWKLPGDRPRPHAVYVDDADKVWLSDFSANAIVHFDPVTEAFNSVQIDRPGAEVRSLHGRSGEAWAADGGSDRLIRIQTVKPA